MAEDSGENISKLTKLRQKYLPLRQKAQENLETSGIKSGTRFRKARGKFAKEMYKMDYDAVTGLPVRRRFEERLEEELARSERFGTPLTFCLVDLNDLKKINEISYPEGDKALRTVAHAIEETIRETDFVARYGGDEFAILFTGSSEEVLSPWWGRFTEMINGDRYTVTASAMHINRANVEQTRIDITQTLKETKTTGGRITNQLVKPAA